MAVQINQAELNRINDEFMRRVDAGSLVIANEMTRLLTLHDGASMGSVRNKQTGRKRKKLRYGVRRSKPGESPYKQTGTLSQSVAIERRPAELSCRIGDGVLYGSILELTMDRPHMRLSLDNTRTDVLRILGG